MPVFEPISLEKQALYRKRLDKCPEKTSDYSFINVWAWKDIYQLKWWIDQELVWIWQEKPFPAFWAPVGLWENTDWQEKLALFSAEERTFTRIPDALYRQWLGIFGQQCQLYSDRDHWDYVYLVQDLIELSGNRFHKKKNLLRQFEKSYDYRYIPLDAEMTEKALTLQTEWCLWRDCEDSYTLEAENQAIINTLACWSELEQVKGGALQVDEDIAAFTIAEPMDEQTIIIHFEKGCPKYKGAYQAINQMFLKHSAAGFKFVNREQDIGDPGLRKSKESYNPAMMLKKYSGQIK